MFARLYVPFDGNTCTGNIKDTPYLDAEHKYDAGEVKERTIKARIN